MTMGYIMAQDRNPYYDSARDKPDRSEFASLSMDLQNKNKRQPAPSGGSGALKIVVWVVVLVIIAAVVKRFVLA